MVSNFPHPSPFAVAKREPRGKCFVSNFFYFFLLIMPDFSPSPKERGGERIKI
jgi:hypothetical protein